MKKFLSTLTIVLLILSGCGKSGDVTSTSENPSEDESVSFETSTETEEVSQTSFNIFGNDRPFAVMIDNDSSESRPHAGIEDAYLLYEMYVEGRATRIMAVFKGCDTQKIGPVRSSRHYFLDYALDNDALYAHAGWSPLAMEQISSLGVNNLNGLVYEPNYYWRERKYKGDYHSLYTSISNLEKLSKTIGYRTETDTLPFNFTDGETSYEGESAKSLTFPYASFYSVSYQYNEESGMYDRYINSAPHATQSGAKLSAKQIIVQFASNYNLGDGSARQQLDTVGNGKAILITNGVQVPLTWSRESRTSKLVFKTADGKEIELSSKGQTYVQVIPPTMNYTIK
jgi:hypothetical protein